MKAASHLSDRAVITFPGPDADRPNCSTTNAGTPRGPPRLGQVLKRRVPELVQGPALPVRVMLGRGGFEQVLGARVGQPPSPGDRADVGGGGYP